MVYSEEKAKKPEIQLYDSENNKPVPGSVSFVPSVAGLIIAGEVIKDLALRAKKRKSMKTVKISKADSGIRLDKFFI